MAFAVGMNLGASVVISRLFGAGDKAGLRRAVSTAFISVLVLSVLLSVFGYFCSGAMMRWIHTPEDIMADGVLYLKIYVYGLSFLLFYNVCTGIFTALGDSKTPLYFLVASAILNVLGDLLFVAVFGWGVAGSAISTVLSEASSCLFCALYIRKRVPLLCLGKRWFVFDKSLMKKTISYGSTSAMQQVCLQIGKTIIQAVVNTQGVSVMAAFTAVNRVDDFAYIPQQNIGHAMTTFIAQNKGAGKKERIRRGFQSGIGIELVYGLILLVLMYFGAEKIMGLFTSQEDAQVVALGRSYLHLVSWMYILPAITNGIQGFFRGMGDLKVTLYSTFMNMAGRVLAVIVMFLVFHFGFVSLAWANLIGWIVMLLFEIPLLMRQLKELRK